jgi:hypothetical protein
MQSGVEPPQSKAAKRSFGPAKGAGSQDDNQKQGDGERPHSKEAEFAGAGDQLVRFTVKAPAKILPGKYELKAWAKRADEEEFETSLEPLLTLPTRMWSEAALAFGELSRYDAICIGIRAYELRSDLARANQRLLDYAAAGGTLVVQYQREGVWNAIKPAPYTATIGNGLRTTDENSPVRVLEPLHPLLNFPNSIRIEDYSGWVQERGLYYWGTFDAKYTPVLAMKDPGEQEALGALVYAKYGKGVYIYTGLSFFRQLPEGVPGAYRLFVNLLSQGRKN